HPLISKDPFLKILHPSAPHRRSSKSFYGNEGSELEQDDLRPGRRRQKSKDSGGTRFKVLLQLFKNGSSNILEGMYRLDLFDRGTGSRLRKTSPAPALPLETKEKEEEEALPFNNQDD
ncbi:MAG: hypothetical protein L6R40_007322, partial [Gallowayella cf. fulva]